MKEKTIFKSKMILILLFICSMLSCNKAEDLENQGLYSSLIKNESAFSGINYYYVSQWSNGDVNSLGLREVLSKISLEQSIGIMTASIIYLTADIDIWDYEKYNINVPSNVTITGGGNAYGESGWTIKGHNPAYTHLFIVRGENVTFERLKLLGPWPHYLGNSEYVLAGGIFFEPNANNGVVQFCEISGFPASATTFRSENNTVYGNNIHDNYMLYGPQTMGYGVSVENGGSAIIHHNYFNNNQHAISGGGKNSSGIAPSFTAYKNEVRDSGGRMRSHHFDMHGNSTDPNDWDCGNYIHIYDNAFYYNANLCNAIHIRGVPQDLACVHHNVFVNVWRCDINYAVRQIPEITGNQMNFWNMYVFDNVVCGYGPPYNQGQWTPGL